MKTAGQALIEVAETLEKYKKNKTLVAPEDLAGKYKVPFEELKQQLKAEVEEYLRLAIFEGLVIRNDEAGGKIIDAINQAHQRSGNGRAIGQAAFKEFDLDKIIFLAGQQREKIYNEIWVPYFHKFTCLYADSGCFDVDNPKTPRIYNMLVDKFYDEDTSEWIKKNNR